MLLAGYARGANRRSQTVNKYRRERARIFVRDHAGDRPRRRCVFRWERDTTLAESSPVIILQRAFAAEGVLHCKDWSQAVDRRFTCQDAGFNLMIVVREMSPQIHSAANAQHRPNADSSGRPKVLSGLPRCSSANAAPRYSRVLPMAQPVAPRFRASRVCHPRFRFHSYPSPTRRWLLALEGLRNNSSLAPKSPASPSRALYLSNSETCKIPVNNAP